MTITGSSENPLRALPRPAVLEGTQSHTHTRSIPVSLRRVLARLAFALSIVAPALALRAQSSTGAIAGSVVDAGTGKYLEGADVAVDSGAIQVTTGRDGRFVLNNIASGSHTIAVSYPGLESTTSTVVVNAGQTANLPIRLGGTSDVVKLAEFKVAGTLHVSANQAEGVYLGTFDVTLNYN